MIEHVKKKFADNKDVVFLALNADDDRSLVPAFIREQKWEGPLYYEGGLAKLMNIGSLPTLLILDGRGQVTSRMAGYIPEKFESMLEQRILDTREPQNK
jgi:thioredoxin-related protein